MARILYTALFLIGTGITIGWFAGGGQRVAVSEPTTILTIAEVVLRDEGFMPREITIIRGATVTFRSESTQFWPAADPHPVHTSNPAFDPSRPLRTNESWAFQFTEVGRWQYHDHIRPYYTGVITVVDH